MKIKILKSEKNDIEFELESLSIAELLRVYLNRDDSVIFAAWKRDHPTTNPIMLVRTKGKTAKKAINDALEHITKELDESLDDFKKMK